MSTHQNWRPAAYTTIIGKVVYTKFHQPITHGSLSEYVVILRQNNKYLNAGVSYFKLIGKSRGNIPSSTWDLAAGASL